MNRAVPQAKGGTGLASNATLLNSGISISAAGTLLGGGGGTVTASGVGAIQTNLGNAPTTILNSNTTKADVGLTNVADASIATIMGNNLTGTIGNTPNATVAVAHTKAGTETDVSGTARTFMNTNGLIVKDANNVIRVKIGNLSAL